MWAHLTHFYAGGPELAAAWGFIGAAQPLAQVNQAIIALHHQAAASKDTAPLPSPFG